MQRGEYQLGGGHHSFFQTMPVEHRQASAQSLQCLSAPSIRGVLNGKKKVFRYEFSQKDRRALYVLNHGLWQLAVGGWRRMAVHSWQPAVGGGWRWLAVVGGWRRLAVVGSWRLVAAGGWRRLVAGGWWRLVVGGW